MEQLIQPGLVDEHLEFFRSSNHVMATYQGQTFKLRDLPEQVLEIVAADLEDHPEINAALDEWGFTENFEKIEKYISCRFSGLDMHPDLTSCGSLTPDYCSCPLRGTCPYEGLVCIKLEGPGGVLTPREIEILDLITTGNLQKNIASQLGICEVTVSKHRKSLFDKTGTDSSVGLTNWVHNKNLTPLGYGNH